VQNLERFVAAFAIAIYLAAAFLPCETPLASIRVSTQPAGRALDATALGDDASISAHDHAAHDRNRENTSAHRVAHDLGHGASHPVGGDLQGDVDHSAHHALHTASASTNESRSRRAVQQAKLEIKPTCLCGCSETRSSIGGGTARLGSVVPGTVVASLIEAAPIPAAEFAQVGMLDLHFDIDPVPI